MAKYCSSGELTVMYPDLVFDISGNTLVYLLSWGCMVNFITQFRFVWMKQHQIVHSCILSPSPIFFKLFHRSLSQPFSGVWKFGAFYNSNVVSTWKVQREHHPQLGSCVCIRKHLCPIKRQVSCILLLHPYSVSMHIKPMAGTPFFTVTTSDQLGHCPRKSLVFCFLVLWFLPSRGMSQLVQVVTSVLVLAGVLCPVIQFFVLRFVPPVFANLSSVSLVRSPCSHHFPFP